MRSRIRSHGSAMPAVSPNNADSFVFDDSPLPSDEEDEQHSFDTEISFGSGMHHIQRADGMSRPRRRPKSSLSVTDSPRSPGAGSSTSSAGDYRDGGDSGSRSGSESPPEVVDAFPGGENPTWARAFVALLPSVVTLSALCCGISSIRSAYLGDYHMAVGLLSLSAVLDGLDGLVARLLNATSQFGAELDSLCDLVDFGVVPCVVVYLWASRIEDSVISDLHLWMCGLFYAACCAYRLARFNLTNILSPKAVTYIVSQRHIAREQAEANGPATSPDPAPTRPLSRRHFAYYRALPRRALTGFRIRGQRILDDYVSRQKFFRGVPAPMGGALALLPIVLSLELAHGEQDLTLPAWHRRSLGEVAGMLFGSRAARWCLPPGVGPVVLDARVVAAIVLLSVGVLMVSRLPTFSSKMIVRNPVTESHLLPPKSPLMGVLRIAILLFIAGSLVLAPWRFGLLFSLLYIGSLPIGPIVWRAVD
ncbi:hypothetical protein H696_04440 [Fonticula alba]|uniref:CDP-diacylglycerol-serine O-phosphatidyltransferase n=1 Tax=Fonticula alba TaxID=691883 RepID=A0A058Z455_FONAL|nr:hypothetical protein H696_04440 [Fonticula alba]KCV69020.1 hypothetical protein H696_04440 [Fonticula alba]|eukprot:XP_009496591.1 hypothetical protein H696_04440 [Fonticula alba]